MAKDQDPNKSSQLPLDIARETFKQMAMQRIVPTPDNYERLYNELAGLPPKDNLEAAIKKALIKLPHESSEQTKWVNAWNKLLNQKNWDGLSDLLSDGMDLSVNFSRQWPDAIRDLLKSWDSKQSGLDNAKKKETLERVLIKFGTDPTLAQKLQAMALSWMEYEIKGEVLADIGLTETKPNNSNAEKSYDLVGNLNQSISEVGVINTSLALSNQNIPDVPQILDENYDLTGISNRTPDPFQQNFRLLQDVLRQSLKHGLIPRLDGYPDVQEEAFLLSQMAERAKKVKEWQEMASKFRALLVRVELIGANEEGIKQDLIRLLKLLLDNIGELVADDQWLRGQISVVQTIISSPLERQLIGDAEKSLKEVIYKQGLLKHSLAEAKNSFKNMVATFVDRLGVMSDSTGTYGNLVEEFAQKIAMTDDIAVINQLLEKLMNDTHTMQADIVRSRDELIEQRDLVDSAQEKIKKLEDELLTLSEKVRIDQLTGVLNRRGMDEALTREVARVERSGGQLSVALLDIDNFKRLNDTYGHHVGDAALQHLASVIQETVRPTDIVSRFGGEEFVILLPNTDLEQATTSLVRLQRALTKRFFMGGNEQLLITFSAGVAIFQKNEDQASVLHRADQAMYLAKKTGKNKTMTENDLNMPVLAPEQKDAEDN